MDAQATLDAEERLSEFFVLPLFARESAWAEIAENLTEDELVLRSTPAPITLRWPMLRRQ
jgi:hypothetical protein